jgi:hypothetical protein
LLLDPRGAVDHLQETLDAMLPFFDGSQGDLDADAKAALTRTRFEVRRVLGN